MKAPQPRLLKKQEAPKKIAKPFPEAKPEPTKDTGVGGSSLDTMMSACITELMNAQISFHKLHLRVTGEGSYAAHKALNGLYDAIPDLADTLVEGYQGVTEKLLTYREISPRTLDSTADAINYLRDIYAMVNKLQGMMPYSEIVNNLDLVKDAVNSAKYKLLFLK